MRNGEDRLCRAEQLPEGDMIILVVATTLGDHERKELQDIIGKVDSLPNCLTTIVTS